MSMNIEKHVSIIGSCISRDIFGFNNDKEFIIDRFIQSISPISAASNRLINVDYQTVMNDIRDEYCNINFYKRNFALDLTGRTFDYLYEYSSDYLLIDMAGCRYDILENNKGELLTRIRDLHQEEILSDFCKKYKVSSFDKLIDSEEDIQKLMDEYIPRYFDMILKAYKVDQIILLETDAVDFCLKENGELIEFKKENSTSWKSRIQYGDNLAEQKLKGCHVIRFPSFVIGDVKHKWGSSRLHYINKFYKYAFQAINIIFDRLPYVEEKKKLDDLYNVYCHEFEDIFLKAVSKTLKQKSIVEFENIRFKKYNAYFQELLLNEDKLKKIINYMEKHNFRSCALYGITQIAVFLYDYLRKFKIDINYMVENGQGKTWKEIPCYSRNITNYPKTDIIIIADVISYDKIKEKIEKTSKIPTINIYELIS